MEATLQGGKRSTASMRRRSDTAALRKEFLVDEALERDALRLTV